MLCYTEKDGIVLTLLQPRHEAGTWRYDKRREGTGLKDQETMENTKATTEVILQYREYEVNMDDVTERVKAHYVAKGFKADSIQDMQIYVKPEDFTAYYVINDGVVGKVNLF